MPLCRIKDKSNGLGADMFTSLQTVGRRDLQIKRSLPKPCNRRLQM